MGAKVARRQKVLYFKSYLIVKILVFKNFILKFFHFFHLHVVKLLAASSALGEVYAHFVNLSLEKSV